MRAWIEPRPALGRSGKHHSATGLKLPSVPSRSKTPERTSKKQAWSSRLPAPTALAIHGKVIRLSSESRTDSCSQISCRCSGDAFMARARAGSAMRTHWTVGAGNLKLHACFFDVRSGVLERLGTDGNFKPVAE